MLDSLLDRLASLLSEAKVQLLLIFGSLLLLGISSYVNLPRAFNGEHPYDFPNYYFGGLRFLENRAIYDYLRDEVYQSLGWHNRVYPADTPFTIILLSPLALMPYKSAWITLAVISTLFFSLAIYLTCSELRFSRLTSALVVSVALSSKPFRLLLFTNHFETLVLLLSVLGWLLLRRRRLRAGLVLWTIAASLKLFPLLWLVAATRVVGVKRVFESLLLFLVIFLLSGLLVGIDNFYSFLSEVLSRSSQWYGTVANYSLISFGYAFDAPLLAWGLEFGFVLIFCYFLCCKFQTVDELWCSSIFASLLLSPLCWLEYLVLTIPCLILIIHQAIGRRHKMLYLILCAVLIWGTPEMVNTRWTFVTILLSFVPTAVLCFLWASSFLSTTTRSRMVN